MENAPHTPLPHTADIFERSSKMGFGDIHFKHDPHSGMCAIIAIHSTTLGPALGGCRYLSYPSTDAALDDVMNLSRAMTYKAAMAGLPLGGGKAVIIRPKRAQNREALFEAYGNFVNELGGRYISSVDSGTGTADMDIAARNTQWVRSTSDRGDPSPSTALGVCHGIEAAVKHKLGRDDINGLHVTIQGVGHVGYYLAKELYAKGARLTVSDINQAAAQRCAKEFKAAVVSADEIIAIKADVFSPCALGGVINDATVDLLNVDIVAGAANNALAHESHAITLHDKGILYAPDYVINAGGLMQVWVEDPETLNNKLHTIGTTLITLFQRAAAANKSPAIVVNHMADEIIHGRDSSGESL